MPRPREGARGGNRPKSSNLRPLARLFPMLTRYRGRLALAFAALVVAAAATLTVPIAVRRVIDHGFTGGNGALVDAYFAVMLAIIAALALASAARFYLVTWLGERVVADTRDALFRHLLDLSPGFYEVQRVAFLAPGRAGLELAPVGHHHVDLVVFGMDVLLHGASFRGG